ncbi:tripartite tricarboxylate transporter substrate binding protein, partial [Escherichia coli]
LDISVWFGILGPRDLPADVKARFEQAVTATMGNPAVQQEFRDRYYEVVEAGPAAMTRQLDTDLGLYSALASKSGISLDPQ